MKTCDRRWEVEALRDKRIAEAERARVERHIAGCSDCSAEQRAFERLGAELAALPHQPVDELSVRRRRAALLARAYEDSVHTKQRGRRWPGLALVACGLAAGLVAWQVTRDERAPQTPPVAMAPRASEVLITADAGAYYTRSENDEGTAVVLVRGRIRVEVRGTAKHQGVVVSTPDGEVVDQGTIFTVSVEGERTRSVEVATGSVIVRIRGLAPRFLQAGERFAPYETVTAVLPPEATNEAAPKAERPRVRAARPRTTSPDAALDRDDQVFESAVAALNQGRLGESAEGFAHFIARHPEDARAEDAAFLRIVALKRNHRDAEASQDARAYLSRYPRGLRVRDVERMVAEQ